MENSTDNSIRTCTPDCGYALGGKCWYAINFRQASSPESLVLNRPCRYSLPPLAVLAQTSAKCIPGEQRVFNVGCASFVGKAYR